MNEMKQLLEDILEWGKLATFNPNRKLPVYNWFYFKEGFTRDLVFKVIDMFNMKNGLILDPFCGSGTTPLACKERRIDSIGFDIMPICVLASQVKTNNYEIDKLKETAKFIFKQKFEKTSYEFPDRFRRFFKREVLDDVFFFKNIVDSIENESTKNFFLLALINSVMKCSYVWKDGAVLKIRKHNIIPFRKVYKKLVFRMMRDYDTFSSKLPKTRTIAEIADSRRMKLENDSVDGIITSPPYLNNIDYTKVYEIENFFTYPDYSKDYIGMKENNNEEKKYFSDMELVLKEMYRVCRNNAKVALVVGNAYIQGRIVDSDLILSKMADNIGFSIEKIFILNKRYALEKRTIKKGILRESLIILGKE